MASVPPCRRTDLTVGDVYMLLEDGSHFPRPSHPTSGPFPEAKRKGKEKAETPILGEESCPSCGIKKYLHPGCDVKREEGAVHWTCAVVPTTEQRFGTRLPSVNLTKVLTWSDGLGQAVQGPPLPPASSIPNQIMKMFLPPCQQTPRDLVAFNPPGLILAVHKIVSKLHLATFPDFAPCGENPTFLTKREPTERCLAPAALLSATLKPFISTLLRSAVEIAKRDVTSIAPGTKNGRGKRGKKFTFVLTPGHVLRGLRVQPSSGLKAVPSVARAVTSYDPRARESATLCLARLGVRLDFGGDAPARSGTNNAGYLIGQTTVTESERTGGTD